MARVAGAARLGVVVVGRGLAASAWSARSFVHVMPPAGRGQNSFRGGQAARTTATEKGGGPRTREPSILKAKLIRSPPAVETDRPRRRRGPDQSTMHRTDTASARIQCVPQVTDRWRIL
jgi:hypothetical protein